MSTIIDDVVEEHAEEVSFVWSQRLSAATSPLYDLEGLCRIDERVEAHLDGLIVAERAGWEVCERACRLPDAGSIFAAAMWAVHHGDLRALAKVIDICARDPILVRGVVSALGWAPYDRVRRICEGLLLGRCPPELHQVGIAALAIQRVDPGAALGNALYSEYAPLKRRALRACGELGRADLMAELVYALSSADPESRFGAAWSAGLLGEPASMTALRELAVEPALDERLRVEACMAATRRMDPKGAHGWIEGVATAGGARVGLAGAAALGDPALVPWILGHGDSPATARMAGAALTMITGVHLVGELTADRPAVEDGVEIHPDEGLPWPNRPALEAWWSEESERFRGGTRYLLGRPMAPEWLSTVLRAGHQSARAAAAVELTMRKLSATPFEVRAPGRRQRAALGAVS